jgi:hypothetical protein
MIPEEHALKVMELIKEKKERAKKYANTVGEGVFCCNLLDELMDEINDL